MNSIFRTTAPIRQLSRSFSATATRGNLNKVQLIGRVGADPTVTEVGDDRRVVNYTVATSETRPDKEGNLIKKTQWHRIVSWNSADWLPQRVKKGDLVYVEGQLRYSDYTDKEGIQRTKADIYQSNFRYLSSARGYAQDDE
ncbi:hypothetical protein BC941DRAFT_428119 [Chlamydoabsidia padenii]|nr:hypothetical protein BC941DRAFT_428119 [Chlamydoabsidia padenii]